MKLSIPKKFIIITVVIYAGAFIFFFILNNYQFAPKEIDLYFKSEWILNKSLLMFFENIIPLQCVSVIFTFSVFSPGKTGDIKLSPKNFNQLVTIVIIIILSLTALFFVGNEMLKPGLYQRTDSYAFMTKTARTLLEHARAEADEGNYIEAEKFLQRYLAIKEDDPEGTALLEEYSERISNQYSVSDIDLEANTDDGNAQNLSYDEALQLARRYLENEDYYSAYYYSQIASGLSDSNQDARSLTSRAWAALSKISPSREESREFQLFSMKKRGTELLLGDKPIEAYYLFRSLESEYPNDPDVIKYLNESISMTRNLTYFIDEAEDALSFPGINEIYFLNRNTSEGKELVFIGKMVNTAGGIFFENIEVFGFSPPSGVTRHITAKYGKLVGEYIVINGIGRENREFRIFPEYLVSNGLPEMNNTLKLNVDWNNLKAFGSGNVYDKLSLIELMEVEDVVAVYGRMEEPVSIEIISRILMPCGFIILSLLMIALSWKYRKLTGRMPILGILLIPIVVYITIIASDAYMYAVKILYAWIFLGTGKTAAITLITASQIALLLIAFMLIARLNLGEDAESGG